MPLEPLVEKFKALTETMEDNPEYAEAKGLVQQARRVLESAFEDLLRKAQIMGQTAFKDALKLDPSLWVDCENEWGQGPGYRDRVAGWNDLSSQRTRGRSSSKNSAMLSCGNGASP